MSKIYLIYFPLLGIAVTVQFSHCPMESIHFLFVEQGET